MEYLVINLNNKKAFHIAPKVFAYSSDAPYPNSIISCIACKNCATSSVEL